MKNIISWIIHELIIYPNLNWDTNSKKNGVFYREKLSYLEEMKLVENSVQFFQLTFSPLLAGGGLVSGNARSAD